MYNIPKSIERIPHSKGNPIKGKKAMKKQWIPKVTRSLAALLAALVLWTLWGNTALMTHRTTISSGRIPAAFSGLRIAQISDLHNAEFGEENVKLLQMLSECHPSLIAVTGDLIDSRRTDLKAALHFAREATQIAPVYYVPGNHEALSPQYSELKAGLEEAGVILLEDKAVQLEQEGEKITLIGLSDPSFTIPDDRFGETPAMIRTKLDRLADPEGGYTILLSHRPELFDVYAASQIDLVFSGHAHGGQFRLPWIGGLVAPNQGLFPQYDAGLYTSGNTQMFVSRGIGNSIIPLRFNNRPEIVLAELISKRNP